MEKTGSQIPTVSEITASLTYGTWRFQKNWKPLHVVDAEGCYFTDAAGKKYLDFSSQLMCVTLGYKNKAVIQAIQDQAASLPYIAPGFATDVRAELSTLLLDVLPRGLEKFFYTTSGTEANEAAFKIARMVTGKTKIIARYHSYHGSTMGSVAATGDPRRWAMEPAGKIPGVIFAPEVNCYRCPLHHHYPECEIACVEYIDHMIENESDVAAVLVEPVVGTNGVLIPPREYMPRLREICTRRNVLLIADEVMTGWGRTGKWFAVNHWDVLPDILTTAKGITTAYVDLHQAERSPDRRRGDDRVGTDRNVVRRESLGRPAGHPHDRKRDHDGICPPRALRDDEKDRRFLRRRLFFARTYL